MDVRADSLEQLRSRTSEKWVGYPDDVLPLFVAEMDYPLAEPISKALIEAVRRSDTGYANQQKDPLPAAFSRFAADRWGWQVDPERVTLATDVSVVLVEALRLVIEPGDAVIITPPIYPPFFDLVPEAGGRVVEVPMLDDGTIVELDLDGIDAAFAAGAKAMLLCNPHNPLGHQHPLDQLTRLAEIADAHDAIVVSDEIHAPLTHPGGRFVPFLSVSDAARKHGIAAHSASKAWNLAGLKCAQFVTADDRMSRLIGTLPDEVYYRASLFGRIASTAAYSDGAEWLDGVLRAIGDNALLLQSLLAERLPAVRYRVPSASYLAWLDFSALGWGDDPSKRILDDARVALVRGLDFGRQGAGFARLNIACSPGVLTEAIDRIARLA